MIREMLESTLWTAGPGADQYIVVTSPLLPQVEEKGACPPA